MSAEIIVFPTPARANAAPAPREDKRLWGSIDYLVASTTFGLFRAAAAKAGWLLPQDSCDAAVKLAAKLMEPVVQMRDGAERAGLVLPGATKPEAPTQRRRKRSSWAARPDA